MPTLNPYSIREKWWFEDTAIQWDDLIGDYLLSIARACRASGTAVIGHIKALVLLPDQKFLRVSVVGPDLPVGIEGDIPQNVKTLEITLNVIVYGLEEDVIEKLSTETARQIAAERHGHVEFYLTQHTHPHDHDHQHG